MSSFTDPPNGGKGEIRPLRLVHPAPPPKPREKPRHAPYLFSEDEQNRLRAALKTARGLMGSWPCLAAAMYVGPEALIAAANGRSRVSPEIAVRLARALGKPLESLYSAPTDAKRCLACGRST